MVVGRVVAVTVAVLGCRWGGRWCSRAGVTGRAAAVDTGPGAVPPARLLKSLRRQTAD